MTLILVYRLSDDFTEMKYDTDISIHTFQNNLRTFIFQLYSCEKWFETQLLPNIPPDSLIAMDNASYHSRRKEAMPTSSWRKGDMITWLMDKGIPYPDKNTKKILYDIIRKHKDQY